MAQITSVRNPALKEAFANGYAFFGESLTPHALNTYFALAATEATLAEAEAVGAREGLYATLYARRERLDLHATEDIVDWTNRFTAYVTTDAILKLVQQQASEATTKQRRATRTAIELALFAMLQRESQLSDELHTIVAVTLRKAKAEGLIAGVALTALKDGGKQPTLDDLYTETYKSVTATSGTMSTTVNSAINLQIGGMAGDVAKEMPTTSHTIGKLLAAGIGASLYLDYSAHRSYTTGQSTSYRRSGTYKVNFTTVGDAKVCPQCLAIEAGNPYSIDDVPHPPQHVNCRCWLTPVGGTT